MPKKISKNYKGIDRLKLKSYLKDLIDRRKKSLGEIANEMGMDYSSLYQFFNRANMPTDRILTRLIHYLGLQDANLQDLIEKQWFPNRYDFIKEAPLELLLRAVESKGFELTLKVKNI